jgi:16S rRNA (cytosine967-C5)-methyltransferase
MQYLGVTHSHPEWLVRRLLERHGFEAAERWVRFDNEPPDLTIRVNRLRLTREALLASLTADGIAAVPTRWAPDGLAIRAGNPLRTPADGSFVVQDEASQIVALMLRARPGERVLDMCASPGGKTTAVIAGMQDSGCLVACDVRDRRIALLRSTVRASGAQHVRIVRIGTAGPLPFAARFDRVLVDAPCSGLGTVRRDPDIRWRRTEGDLAVLAADQRDLLARAADVVRPGGRLVYATCSSEPEENEHVVQAFLEANSEGWRLVDLRDEIAPALQPLLDAHGMLRTLPHEHGLEAFFAAELARMS